MNDQTEIERATSLLTQGKVLESAAVAGSILARQPQNAVAAHLLGLALKDSGDWAQGEQWLRQSIRLAPERAEFHANLAHLLRRQEKYIRAERVYRRALALAPDHRPARRGLALTLNDLKRFAEAEAECRILLASDPTDAESWVLLGMALDSQGRLAESEIAYRRAIDIDPRNKIAHHNLGALLSRLQRPEAAIEALETARTLGADGYEMAFNRGYASLDINDLAAAEQQFERAVMLQPTNTEAQLNLARVRFMRGDPKFARALASASQANRDNVELQLLLGHVLWRAGKLVAAETLMHDLLARKGPDPTVQSALAGILLEQGMLQDAEARGLEAATAKPDDPFVIETLVNILLARGFAADAQPFIAAQRRKYPQSQAWIAYEATAARALGQDRYLELYDYDRLVRVFDVEPPPGFASMAQLNQALLGVLNDRHRFNQHPLDQTLRNGTQTARSLVNDPDPTVRAIMQAFDGPIEQYRRALGTDPQHPLSARNSGVSRFAGAWSVRLRRLGFHVNHFHPEGWISSAYYVEVPPEAADPQLKSGWIKFGEPRYQVPGMDAQRWVQPRPGQLVLFPSYMWHGTSAIHGDEPRVAIAFDVTPARE